MLIDSNIFLELYLDQQRADECEKFLEKVNKGQILCTISDFSIDSMLLILSRETNKTETLEKLLNSIIAYSGLSIYFITIEDRLKAIEQMKKHKLDFEDAMTLQAALASGNTKIVSFDKHFNKTVIERLEPKDVL